MIALIILQYNNWSDTKECILSIEKYNTAPVKYIVVDNASTQKACIEETRGFLSATFPNACQCLRDNDSAPECLPQVVFLESCSNDGYAQGNNKGIRLCLEDDEIDAVLILNNDVLFTEDILPFLHTSLYKIKDVGIITPLVYNKDMSDFDYACARNHPSKKELVLSFMLLFRDIGGSLSKMKQKRNLLYVHPEYTQFPSVPIELPCGSFMLFKKEVIQRIGGFDPNTFLYFEEDILYKRLSGIHLQNYLIPSCSCIHLGCSTTKSIRSTFLSRCMVNSISYYLNHYERLTFLEKAIVSLSKVVLFFLQDVHGISTCPEKCSHVESKEYK